MSPATTAGTDRSRRRFPRALAIGALAGLAALGTALAVVAPWSNERDGAGATQGATGPLAWKAEPRLYSAPGTGDRILTGVVRNDSVRVAEVEARDVRVIAAEGDRLESAAIFLPSFARGLYAGSRLDRASDIERRRTGRLLRIGPGGEQPLTVSWRARPGQAAERIEYGAGALPVP